MSNSKKTTRTRKRKNENAPFPTTLRALREEYSISQEEIADELKISRQTISDYQWGETIPDIETAYKIVDFFNARCKLNYSMDTWMGREELVNGIKRKEISLSHKFFETLKGLEKNHKTILTLESLVEQKDFLKSLANYIIDRPIIYYIDSNKELEWFCSKKMLFTKKGEPEKYWFYDVQEQLPLLKNYAEIKVRESLEKGNDILFSYIMNTKLDREYFKTITDEEIKKKKEEMNLRKKYNESHEFKKKDEEYRRYLSENCYYERAHAKELYEKQKEFKGKEVKNNVRSRTRKGKKV